MTAQAHYDVVVVGLGPVGAVAANLAGAAGLRTLVVERATGAYAQPRAIVFDAEIMRVFDSIGLSDSIATVTRPLGGSVYLGADRQPIRTFRAPAPAHEGAWSPSNLFFQPDLEAVLRNGLRRFGHVQVVEGRAADGIRAGATGASLIVDGMGEVSADVVLACDGASSPTRKALGIGLDDIGFEERWLVVDTFVDGPMRWPDGFGVPDEVRDGRFSLMVCDPERPATLIPGVGRHRRWEYMLMAGEHPGDVVPQDWTMAQIGRWVDPADVELLRSAVYRFRALIAERWREGRVFLLGDAAHQTPPFFGQGMCHGIRDAAQLMWKLLMVRDGTATEALLDTYQIEREPHVRAIVAASVAAGAAVCKLDPGEARARDAEFRRIEAERAGRPVAMTDVVPPITAGAIDPITGGARVPELLLDGPTGPVALDALLGGRFTLLSLDAETPAMPSFVGGVAVGARGPLRDRDGALARWLGGSRYALIRPDRYLHSLAVDADALARQVDLLRHQLDTTAARSQETTT